MDTSILIEHSANTEILNAFCKGDIHLRRLDGKALCSISGGSDSDILLDMIRVLDPNGEKVDFIFFDTGLEYEATKEHLLYLEQRYNCKIIREEAKKAIPTCCKEYGIPWFSKYVSEMMSRLQAHNFQWEIDSFENLLLKYPHCKAALRWWCNAYTLVTDKRTGKIRKSSYNINRHNLMREFISTHPPTFRISNACCTFAKKLPAKEYLAKNNYSLNIIGVRRAEGGIRATSYTPCFSAACESSKDYDEWRPLFWFSDADKQAYEQHCGIVHSKCYTEYGLTRTGCFGCPYNSDFNNELLTIKQHEPKLYNAAISIFGPAYDYSRKYYQFKKAYSSIGAALNHLGYSTPTYSIKQIDEKRYSVFLDNNYFGVYDLTQNTFVD